MKNIVIVCIVGLVFALVSCSGEKKQEPATAEPAETTAPAQEAEPAAEPEANTKLDVKLNTKDGSVEVDLEKKD